MTTATVRRIADATDEILGARVESDGLLIGRVRRNERGYWTAYDPAGRRISTTSATRRDAVDAVAARATR